MLHKELNVWKVAMELVKLIYQFAVAIPASEQFGLVSQMKRAAVSIPANIAEGAGRNHTKENIQFAHIALGSLSELDTLVILTHDLYHIDATEVNNKMSETKKLLLGYIKYLKSKQH